MARKRIDEIMRGVQGARDRQRSAYNEVTFWTDACLGHMVVRYHETNILEVEEEWGKLFIRTGGYNTVSTRKHLNDALKRHGFPIRVKKGRDEYIKRAWGIEDYLEAYIPSQDGPIRFVERVSFRIEGKTPLGVLSVW